MALQMEYSNKQKPSDRNLMVTLFFIGHIILAFLFKESSLFLTIHALLTLLIGIVWIINDKEPYRPIYVLAYISGAELLWRGLHANVFWEYGKYSSMVLLIFMLLKYKGYRKPDFRGI